MELPPISLVSVVVWCQPAYIVTVADRRTPMTLLRVGLVVTLALGAGFGCAPTGPQRASDIQNVHGIGDDISATTMTDSMSRHTHDPNMETTLPNNYNTVDNP
jgi:hypothetical protein